MTAPRRIEIEFLKRLKLLFLVSATGEGTPELDINCDDDIILLSLLLKKLT